LSKLSELSQLSSIRSIFIWRSRQNRHGYHFNDVFWLDSIKKSKITQ